MIKKTDLKSKFLQYIIVLMTGTVIAQLVGYAFAPIITRIYTPEEGAELGLFLRIIAVGAAIATARYEFALPIAKTDSHSFRLYHISIRLAVIVSLSSILLLLLPVFTGEDGSSIIFYGLMPLAILSLAFYSVGSNWAIRLKLFKSISFARISNSLIGSLAKIAFGWMHVGYIGLILGATIGLIVSNFWFFVDFIKANTKFKIKSRSPRNFLLAKEYSEFPKINLPHVLMELGKDLLVAVLLLNLFTKEDFGLYDHSFRMLRIPLVFAGAAIGQVFFQRCAEMINNGESIINLITRSVKLLVVLSIIPFAIIFFYGEEIFAFVFGENWRGAGVYSEIMAPWFLVNFITSPISSIPLVLRKQIAFFKLAALGTVLMIAAVVLPPLLFEMEIEGTLWILSISQACYLVFVIFKIFEYARNANAEKNI